MNKHAQPVNFAGPNSTSHSLPSPQQPRLGANNTRVNGNHNKSETDSILSEFLTNLKFDESNLLNAVNGDINDGNLNKQADHYRSNGEKIK